MTIDERIERLEFIVTSHIEQARKDYEENRRLWREQQVEIAAIWKATDRRFGETDQRFRELVIAATLAEQAHKDTMERIDRLVSAIGELLLRKSE